MPESVISILSYYLIIFLNMLTRLHQLIFLGVFVELLLFFVLFVLNDNLGDVFRLSARYTGRISFGLYCIMFYHFIHEKSTGKNLQYTYTCGMVFCVLHIIHFAFLSASVYSNQIPIIPFKLAGGFLAYLGLLSTHFMSKE